jgi:SNF2 family DNA or RNA helicase
VRGKDVVVTPHDTYTTAVLRALGIDAPAPILHHYNWPGRFTPYEHQRQTAAFLTLHNKALVLNEIGTGKTQSALWAADYLMNEGLVHKVLIVSPLSTLERVWGDEIFKGFPDRSHVVLHGSADKRKKLLATDADFYIINHDGFAIIAPEAHGMFDLVIIDEAAVLRTPGTQRFKIFRRWMDNNPDTRLWLMTGTPTPTEPTDAWALARLVNSPFCTMSYTAFRDQVMTKVGMYKWLPRPDSVETVRRVLQPAIRYARDECIDLPETVVMSRTVPLSKEQQTHYQTMMRHLMTEADNNEISAANEAVKMQKLIQIACGVVYSVDGAHVELDCAPRVDQTCDIIEEAGGKVIVFVPLTGTLHMLTRELRKRWTVEVVNGAVSSSERNRIFHAFQHQPDPRILLAHPATMAHGLTLTSASTIIWYGPIASNEIYTQANGRIERIGKTQKSTVVHIEATELERRMYTRLATRQKLQGLLLDLIKQET